MLLSSAILSTCCHFQLCQLCLLLNQLGHNFHRHLSGICRLMQRHFAWWAFFFVTKIDLESYLYQSFILGDGERTVAYYSANYSTESNSEIQTHSALIISVCPFSFSQACTSFDEDWYFSGVTRTVRSSQIPRDDGQKSVILACILIFSQISLSKCQK